MENFEAPFNSLNKKEIEAIMKAASELSKSNNEFKRKLIEESTKAANAAISHLSSLSTHDAQKVMIGNTENLKIALENNFDLMKELVAKVDISPLIKNLEIPKNMISDFQTLVSLPALDLPLLDSNFAKSIFDSHKKNFHNFVVANEVSTLHRAFMKEDELTDQANLLIEEGWPLSPFFTSFLTLKKDGTLRKDSLKDLGSKLSKKSDEIFRKQKFPGLKDWQIEELKGQFDAGFYSATYVMAAGYFEYAVVIAKNPNSTEIRGGKTKALEKLESLKQASINLRSENWSIHDHLAFATLFYSKSLIKHWGPITVGESKVTRHSVAHGHPNKATKEDALQIVLLLQAFLSIIETS